MISPNQSDSKKRSREELSDSDDDNANDNDEEMKKLVAREQQKASNKRKSLASHKNMQEQSNQDIIANYQAFGKEEIELARIKAIEDTKKEQKLLEETKLAKEAALTKLKE